MVTQLPIVKGHFTPSCEKHSLNAAIRYLLFWSWRSKYMKQNDTPSSQFHNTAESLRSIDEMIDGVVLDIDDIAAEFIIGCDLAIDNMAWRPEDVFLCHGRYRHAHKRDNNSRDIRNLTDELMLDKVAATREDAEIIARTAIETLYPAINERLRQLDYPVCAVRDVRLTTTPGKKIRCMVRMAII